MTVQIAFYKGRTRLYDRIVQWWLRGPYSHVELILGADDNGLKACASASMMDGGVRIKHMALNPDHWDVITVNADPADAWLWLADHIGEGYDWLGFFGFVFRVLGHDKTRWTCSESVAAMLGLPDAWRFEQNTLYAVLSREHPGIERAVTP